MQPLILTAGDPNGIGPEIILKSMERAGAAPLLVIGDPAHFEDCAAELGMPFPFKICEWGRDVPTTPEPKLLAVRSNTPRRPGHHDPAHAPQVIKTLEIATDLCLSKRARGVVTAPINKAVLKDGGAFDFPGHTEFFAAQTDTRTPVMMLVAPGLRTVPTTIHIPLKEVPTQLTADLLAETITITHSALRDWFGLQNPRIVVAGLNPHAGENGKIGLEELDWIAALVAAHAADGKEISGPFPADTLFHGARRATYDAAICMYHDQALIPVKTLAFDDGVNVTLGLPFIRTSPDHGTAFDIAGKGIAKPDSFLAAMNLAEQLAAQHG